MTNALPGPDGGPSDAADAAEAGRQVKITYAGEKIFAGDYLIEPERENIALRNQIVRYSELVTTTVIGFAFCAFLDAMRTPREYRGWLIFGMLVLIVAASDIVRRRTKPT